jgi:hypothetical protein
MELFVRVFATSMGPPGRQSSDHFGWLRAGWR